jgi:hypothetical protein
MSDLPQKQIYETPEVHVFGDIIQFTAVGLTHLGSDPKGGSVNPPGFEKKGGRP